jgi:hypothetical protein
MVEFTDRTVRILDGELLDGDDSATVG